MVRLPYSGQTGLSPEVVKQARELARAGKYERSKTGYGKEAGRS